MELIEELINLFKEFDIDNIYGIIVICIISISVATSYIQLFSASLIEAVLMDKKEESKRFGFIYLIFFIVFGVINYIFTSHISFVVFNSVVYVLINFACWILGFLKKRGKAINLYWWCKERKDFIMIITTTAISTFVISDIFDINLLSCVILGALVEVIIIAITDINVGNVRSNFTLNIEKEEWYVFKRMDDDCLLCGNKSNINDATRIKILKLEDVIEKKLCFEKKSE